MSILSVRFLSEALGCHTSCMVIHPDEGEGPFPVVMQLHGYSDDYQSWLMNSRIASHAARYPMIIVFPDGGTARYLNLEGHEMYGRQRYEDLVMRDIPAEVNRLFHVREGKWAIGGLSMGGYGALRLGMKHPDRFASIWAHSAALRRLDDAARALVADPADTDVETHAARLVGRDDVPRLSFDCGVDDFLIEPNRAFHAHLDEIGLVHTYREHPGAHTWDYWDEHVVEALAQHAEVLGIEAV